MYFIHSNIACEKSIWYKTCTIIAIEKSNSKHQKIKNSDFKAHTEEPSSVWRKFFRTFLQKKFFRENVWKNLLPYEQFTSDGMRFFHMFLRKKFFHRNVRKNLLPYEGNPKYRRRFVRMNDLCIWKNVLPILNKFFVSYLSLPRFLRPKSHKSLP